MADEKLIEEEWSEEGLDFSDEDELTEEGEVQGDTENPEDADLFFELADDDAAAEESADTSAEKKNDSTDVEQSEQPASGKEKKLFGKKKEKAKSQMEVKIAELEEQRVRQLAEFENFRKRSEREKSQMFEMGAKDVIEKILPVIDNFERGLMGVPEEQKEEPFVQGMELVYKQMLTAFEALGVQPIEAVGKEFDPSMHNAVMAVDDDSLESGTVAEELQKGYLYKDSVVRHSMVKVVN